MQRLSSRQIPCVAVNQHGVEGMDVVRALTARDPSEDPDAPPGDKILTIEIIEK